MEIIGSCVLLASLIWITCSSSTQDVHQNAARIMMSYQTFPIPKTHVNGMLKLIKDPLGRHIYAGGPQGLYVLTPEKISAQLKSVPVPFKCHNNPTCNYTISLLKEGRNGHPLFICETIEGRTKCCDMDSNLSRVNCSSMSYTMRISEASLHVGNELYFTLSKDTDSPVVSGLYRWTPTKCIWPQGSQTEQKYVKIIANEGKKTSNGKVYVFYTEQTTNPDLDTALWIPRVSQVCMMDRGGSKEKLQNRWTSMLSARLFCGDVTRRLSYTELLDIAVLEDKDWSNTSIYALFKNAYNLSALCVYSMGDIISVFTSNEFKGSSETFAPTHPGECVSESEKLSAKILNFMEKRPEMSTWIMPARSTLFNRNQYTHLHVDRVNGHDVLFMSLENGRIHKVLEQDGFIVTEYQPFQDGVHIHSMLFDRSTKMLFVSSSSEVAQIRVDNCSIYETNCASCVMARDPYCSWTFNECSHKSPTQHVTKGDPSVCEKDPQPKMSKSKLTKTPSFEIIPQGSKYFLKCPVTSQHASYTWHHHKDISECVAGQQCLLLIEHMSDQDEGIYECKGKENGQEWTIKHQELRMNNAPQTRAAAVALTCLLLMISVMW